MTNYGCNDTLFEGLKALRDGKNPYEIWSQKDGGVAGDRRFIEFPGDKNKPWRITRWGLDALRGYEGVRR